MRMSFAFKYNDIHNSKAAIYLEIKQMWFYNLYLLENI